MFYTLNQNNSGGSFDFDPVVGIAKYVVIEADSPESAYNRWESIRNDPRYREGEYCECCGERWDDFIGDGAPVPSAYGEPIENVTGYNSNIGDVIAFVHYADGRIEAVRRK